MRKQPKTVPESGESTTQPSTSGSSTSGPRRNSRVKPQPQESGAKTKELSAKPKKPKADPKIPPVPADLLKDPEIDPTSKNQNYLIIIIIIKILKKTMKCV